jgi:protein CpxP
VLKRCLLTLTLCGLTVAASSATFSQDNSSNPPSAQAGEAEHGHGHHFDPEKRTEMLTKHLKLTSDQQPKVLEILKSEQSQMQGLRADSSLSREDRRSKMMDIHKTSNDQIRALLDSNQQKKWDEMQSRHGRGMEHHGQSGASPGSK